MKKIRKIKNKITTIALLLVLTAFVIPVIIPSTFAQTVWKETYAFIQPEPDTVSVNNDVLLWIGITDFYPVSWSGWEGLTVTVTKPDGSTETLGPFKTDATGSTGATYTPTQVGTYYLQLHFPGEVVEEGSTRTLPPGGLYKASDSEIMQLTVTDEPPQYWPAIPLPEEYWTRPISPMFREWATIGGNVLENAGDAVRLVFPSNQENPYTTAPNTAHLLWKKQGAMGGLVGADLDSYSYSDGTSYEGKFKAIIIGGILFRNVFWPARSHYQGVSAIDLKTGEELWFKEGIRVDFGQIMYWNTYNMQGAHAYIWDTSERTTWKAYDPWSGEWWFTLTDVPSGVRIHGPNGEILIYTIDLKNGWMTCWNSSNVPGLYGSALGPEPLVEGGDPNYSWYSWRPYGKTVSAVEPIDPSIASTFPLGLQGYMWNKSIPVISDGIVQKIVGDVILGSNYNWIGPFYWNGGQEHWAISLKQGQEGTLMFRESVQVSGNRSIAIRAASAEDDVFAIAEKETRTWTGYSLTTGKKIWGPTESQAVLDWVGFGETWWPDVIADGKLYSGSFSGILSCYNVKTGELLWNYTATDPYSETLMGPNWAVAVQFIADGKVYIQNYEHGTFMPSRRGSPTICVNATNGEEIWRIPIRSIREALVVGADGVLVSFNGYDCSDYAIGRGPSALTAQAPLSGVTVGSYATIMGTMMDVSPGTEDAAITLRFPNGVPAIADEYMSEWMEYVYMQFPRPEDAVGVPVKIQIVDPAGTYAWIGTATSDAYGNYAYSFIPQMEGQYTVISTFDGSESFYGSTTTTYLQVGPAPSPSSPITPETPETPLITTEVAIVLVAALAAIVIIAFLVLRRRK